MSRKRIAILLTVIAVLALGAGIIVFAAMRDDGSPPPEPARVGIGMTLTEVVEIMGPPTGRGFLGLDDDCASWESGRGVAIVYLDRDGRAKSASWFPVQELEWRRVWRWVGGG